MKIIQRGPEPVDKVARWACYRCKSVLEAPMSEGRFAPSMIEQLEDSYCFKCPVCGQTTSCLITLFKDPEPVPRDPKE